VTVRNIGQVFYCGPEAVHEYAAMHSICLPHFIRLHLLPQEYTTLEARVRKVGFTGVIWPI